MILSHVSPHNLPFSRLSNLAEVLQWCAARDPNEIMYTFLTDGENKEDNVTYAELDCRARQVAFHLRSRLPAGARANRL